MKSLAKEAVEVNTVCAAQYGDRKALLALWEMFHRLGMRAIPLDVRKELGQACLGVVWEAMLQSVAAYDARFGMPGFRGYLCKASRSEALRAWKFDTLVKHPHHHKKPYGAYTSRGLCDSEEDREDGYPILPQLVDSAKEEIAAVAMDAYRKLPEKAQKVVVLTLEGSGQAEAANEFGVSRQMVNQMMQKAVEELDAPKSCEVCGKPLGYNKRKYCSAECRKAAYDGRWGLGKTPKGLKCKFCGHELSGKCREYCNMQCRRLHGLTKGRK